MPVTKLNQIKKALKPILSRKIEEAVNEAMRNAEIEFPWIGDNCYYIMADAAMCVIFGMADHEKFMEKEGLCEVI